MDRELTCINAIPLVDVMLVLLVIVLTAATYVTTGQVSVESTKDP
jgi:biopolymer transport protein ExbD